MPAEPQKLTYLHLARSAKHHTHLRRLATEPGEKCGLKTVYVFDHIHVNGRDERAVPIVNGDVLVDADVDGLFRSGCSYTALSSE